jgi:hypothetical protein
MNINDELLPDIFDIKFLIYTWVVAFFSAVSHLLSIRAYGLYSFAKLAPFQFLGVV